MSQHAIFADECAEPTSGRSAFRPSVDKAGNVQFRFYSTKTREVSLWTKDPRTGAERITKMRRNSPNGFSIKCRNLQSGTRYRFIDEHGNATPDPWSCSQPDGVHGASELILPQQRAGGAAGWKGRPWPETVIYEMHVGTFTREGTLSAAREHLRYVADQGFTAVQIMPVCATPEGPNWGYDGTYPYSVASKYGTQDDLKCFVSEAHAVGLQVILDVVYNHFGPEGNYLHDHWPRFFNNLQPTPWGASLNFDGPGSGAVREFVIDNALFWLEEFKIDGLRIDAPQMMRDRSSIHILDALKTAVDERLRGERHVHLILECENSDTQALGYHIVHHSAGHQFLSHLRNLPGGQESPALSDFFASLVACDRPQSSYVLPIETHDDIGNNQHGRRLWAFADVQNVRLVLAVVLLSPAVPMVFMGDEFAAVTPFNFFCRFQDIDEAAIIAGREREFGAPSIAVRYPFSEAAFEDSKLEIRSESGCSEATRILVRELLRLRREFIQQKLTTGSACVLAHEKRGTSFRTVWALDRSKLILEIGAELSSPAAGTALYETATECGNDGGSLKLRWAIEE